MKQTSKFFQKLLTIIFCILIVWFILYFAFGTQFGLYFTDRIFASWFPHILVFSTAVAIYGLFILQIHARNKKWKNILYFCSGLILASIPFLLYHAYFQYQCGFWNQKIEHSKVLYINKNKNSETVKVLKFKCLNSDENQYDTVFVKEAIPYFEIHQAVIIKQNDKGGWTTK